MAKDTSSPTERMAEHKGSILPPWRREDGYEFRSFAHAIGADTIRLLNALAKPKKRRRRRKKVTVNA